MRKRVLKDVLKIMYPVIGGNALKNIITGYVAIITGATIGSFANAALKGDMNLAVKDLWVLVIALLVGVIGVPAITLINNVFLFKLSLKHDRLILSNFMDKAYDKAITYEGGDISYRLESDPINLRWLTIDIFSTSLEVILVAVGLIYMVFKINTLYAVVCFLIGLFPVIVAFFSGKLENKYELSKKEYDGGVRNLQADICFNFLFIKLYNLKNVMVNSFSKIFSGYYESTITKYINCKAVTEFLNNIFGAISQIVILLLGAYLVSKGDIGAGAVASMMIYLAKVQDVYTKIGGLIKETILLPQCLDRVGDLYMDKEKEGHINIEGFNNLVGDKVAFSFGEGENIFSNVSLKINKGEKLAVKGHNGCGKSTLLKVLSGLYRNYEGNITINGEELKKINLKALRKNISYMEQEPFIFKGTLYDNVAIGNLKAAEKEIEECLEYTGLTPLKDKEIETLGENLSGGEKQRISIARALLRNTGLIFMDEPFNNLDTKGRELIEEILKDKDKTIVFITHDYELLKYGNSVVEM